MKRGREDDILPVPKIPRMDAPSFPLHLLPPELYEMILQPLALIARIALRLTCRALCRSDRLDDMAMTHDIKRMNEKYATLCLKTTKAMILQWCTREEQRIFLHWALTFGQRWLESMPLLISFTSWWSVSYILPERGRVTIKFHTPNVGVWKFRMNVNALFRPPRQSYACSFEKAQPWHAGMLPFGSVPEVVSLK